MNRRTAFALALLFALWAAWVFSKEVTFLRGMDIDYRLGTVENVYVYCGDVVPILWDGEFNEDVSQYLYGQCRKAARSHFAWVVMFGGAAVAFTIGGLVRGTTPRIRDIDTALRRLPTRADLDSQDDPG